MSKILKLFMMLLLTAACSPKDNREELTIIDSDGNKNVYKVELAQTKEELSTGLMNRTALPIPAWSLTCPISTTFLRPCG